MKKVILTLGLPASGKSTWARLEVKKAQGSLKRVNKDDLRNMLDDGKWSSDNEKYVKKLRNRIILDSLKNNIGVIIDDTNLHQDHIKDIVKLVYTNYPDGSAEVALKSFLAVSIKECITRDAARTIGHVGEGIIRSMQKKHIKNKPFSFYEQVLKDQISKYTKPEVMYNPSVPIFDPNLPYCIIVDVDGTLAHMNGRGPFDWDQVGEDKVDFAVRDILDTYKTYYINDEDDDSQIIIFTGRDGSCEDATRKWLLKHGVEFDQLYIRPEGNFEKDSVIKKRMYENHIRGKYNVLFILDDRDRVIRMYREELGLKVFQVAYGDF